MEKKKGSLKSLKELYAEHNIYTICVCVNKKNTANANTGIYITDFKLFLNYLLSKSFLVYLRWFYIT